MCGVRRSVPLAALAAASFVLAACASAPSPGGSPRPVADELRPFLPAPTRLAPATDTAWQDLYARLLDGMPASDVEEQVRSRNDSGPATALLVAECRLVAGDWTGALAAASDGRDWELELVAGKAAEELADPVEAIGHYGRARGSSAVADGRWRALRSRATGELAERVREAIGQGQSEAAQRWMTRLVELDPGTETTLDLQRRLALLTGDEPAELQAVEGLLQLHPGRVDLEVRQSELELSTGHAAQGLALLQELSARYPGDARIDRSLQRARFLFRLSNVPQEVRQIAARPLLTRAAFARLLYWLVPEVRATRGRTPPVATDLVDHPAREEILRVTSLGLLEVDATLHLFDPDRPLRRSEAFRALLARPGLGGAPPCARTAVAAGDACAAALSCGLISEPSECLPAGPVSGREAVDWMQLAIEATDDGS